MEWLRSQPRCELRWQRFTDFTLVGHAGRVSMTRLLNHYVRAIRQVQQPHTLELPSRRITPSTLAVWAADRECQSAAQGDRSR